MARTGRTEQASSDEGIDWKPKCKGKNDKMFGCVEVIETFFVTFFCTFLYFFSILLVYV